MNINLEGLRTYVFSTLISRLRDEKISIPHWLAPDLIPWALPQHIEHFKQWELLLQKPLFLPNSEMQLILDWILQARTRRNQNQALHCTMFDLSPWRLQSYQISSQLGNQRKLTTLSWMSGWKLLSSSLIDRKRFQSDILACRVTLVLGVALIKTWIGWELVASMQSSLMRLWYITQKLHRIFVFSRFQGPRSKLKMAPCMVILVPLIYMNRFSLHSLGYRVYSIVSQKGSTYLIVQARAIRWSFKASVLRSLRGLINSAIFLQMIWTKQL